MPGFNVIVTARRSFGKEEPNWLPGEAIDKLGRAPAVIVDELTDTEIEELRSAARELAPLWPMGIPRARLFETCFD